MRIIIFLFQQILKMKNFNLDEAIRTIIKEENNILLSKIEAVVSKIQTADDSEKPLNFKEALRYMNCSQSYLYKLTSTNQISHSKKGKKLYFTKRNIDQWLLENKVSTISEMEENAASYLKPIHKNKIQ